MKMVAPLAAAVTADWTVLYFAAEDVPTTRAPEGGDVIARAVDARSEVRQAAEKRMILVVGSCSYERVYVKSDYLNHQCSENV